MRIIFCCCWTRSNECERVQNFKPRHVPPVLYIPHKRRVSENGYGACEWVWMKKLSPPHEMSNEWEIRNRRLMLARKKYDDRIQFPRKSAPLRMCECENRNKNRSRKLIDCYLLCSFIGFELCFVMFSVRWICIGKMNQVIVCGVLFFDFIISQTENGKSKRNKKKLK